MKGIALVTLLLAAACGGGSGSSGDPKATPAPPVKPAQPAPPAIAKLDPATARPGEPILIVGSGFEAVTDVYIDGIKADRFERVDGTLLAVSVPQGAREGRITLVTAAQRTESPVALVVQPAEPIPTPPIAPPPAIPVLPIPTTPIAPPPAIPVLPIPTTPIAPPPAIPVLPAPPAPTPIVPPTPPLTAPAPAPATPAITGTPTPTPPPPPAPILPPPVVLPVVTPPTLATVAPAAAQPGTDVTLSGTGLAAVEAVRLRHAGGEDPATLVGATDTTLTFRTGVLTHGQRTVTLVVAGTPYDFPATFHVLPAGVATLAGAAAMVRTEAENVARAAGRAESEVARAGAEAEARYLGASPAAVRVAGDNAANRVIQEAIDARLRARLALRTPEGRRQAHAGALARLDEDLARDFFYEDVHHNRIRMSTDFFTADRVLELEEAARVVAPGTYTVNYDYLKADPYQALFNNDIDRLMPVDVTADEINAMKVALQAAMGPIPVYTANEVDRAFAVMGASADAIKRPLYKRIKRLLDEVQARDMDGRGPVADLVRDWGATAVGELAFQVARQAIAEDGGRCIDGIRDGLTEYEGAVFGSSAEGNEPLHMGEFISQLVADYRAEFISRHEEFIPVNPEYTTTIRSVLGQRMLWSLGLKGGFNPPRYAGHARTTEPEVRPDAVMRRFLRGEHGAHLASHPEYHVDFDAYDVDKLVALMIAARERAFVALDGHSKLHPLAKGLALKKTFIQEDALNEEHLPRDGDNDLGRSYLKFELGAMWDDPLDPDPDHPVVPAPPDPPVFFLPAVMGQNAANTRITREYCIHQLAKYGYIIRN